MKGRIESMGLWLVRCGKCERLRQPILRDVENGYAKSKQQAAAGIRAESWVHTRAFGWLCPDCGKRKFS